MKVKTIIPGEQETSLYLINTLQQGLETRTLPIVDLVSFDGDPYN